MKDMYSMHEAHGYIVSVVRCEDGLEAEVDGGGYVIRMKLYAGLNSSNSPQDGLLQQKTHTAIPTSMIQAMAEALIERQSKPDQAL